ncbi:MAG: DJ-1/PfpI family protein [Balneolaceae bacterium]
MSEKFDSKLPTIGILIFEGFLTNEVVAPMDVFTKKDPTGKTLFNVALIAKEEKIYRSEEGLRVLPDYTIRNSPGLTVLVVPSSNNPDNQVRDIALINFIKKQNDTTEYIASHCAGAFMLGESGVADKKEIVTYPSGSTKLQTDYPDLLVMDDNKISVAKDGKFITSNGNLVSYLASLDLLEQMTSKEHRESVENELLINKLK